MDRNDDFFNEISAFRTSGEGVWDVEILAEIDRDFGRETLERFVLVFGGTKMFVPKHFRPEHRLVAAVGEVAARALIERYGGNDLDIPGGPLSARAHTRRKGIELLKAGCSITEVTRALQVSRSAVKSWKKRYVKEQK